MLVSVYIPTRNRVTLLRRAVDSVLGQTHKDLELIVVDDASSDGTAEHLRLLARQEPRLTYITNPEPRGAPAARNAAIQKAKGHFVTGLDDDDEFLPERISSFVSYWNLLTSHGASPACLYSQDIWMQNGAFHQATHKRSFVSAAELFEYNYIGNQVFAPKAHFIDAGLFDEQLPAWQDLDLLIRMLQRGGQAHLLDMPTYRFDVTLRPDRISSREANIRKAFEIVSHKYARDDASKRQSLFLQMFQEVYAIHPGVADWLAFLRFGRLSNGLLRMVRATLARRNSPFAYAAQSKAEA